MDNKESPDTSADQNVEDGQSLRSSVAALVAPSHTKVPREWVESHTIAEHALSLLTTGDSTPTNTTEGLDKRVVSAANDDQNVLSLAWFAGALGRLHLNVMRTSEEAEESGEPRENTNDASANDGISVLYALGSFFNHGCRPNVVPSFDGACVSWYAARRIEAEEECLISYRDTDQHNQANNESEQVQAKSRPESATDEFLYW
eukprot:CAMPEP_0171925444 /NCGR_PEP_ID=MMETSP0993-20121228/23978_1 /TAXON_ID=483369 /ORGANISM="non described non described, Strain CCMP2098" /LENGTH=202 /DNA_ID=CAMNT_0012564029 /DNA_START=207 /DNA_END=812 /DNA_ORIENTATION=-